MSKVDVTVIKRPLKGVAVGGTLSVSPREARILVGLKRATYKVADPIKVAEPTYQTRMMSAEVTHSDPQPVVDEEEKPKRRYTRRVSVDE